MPNDLRAEAICAFATILDPLAYEPLGSVAPRGEETSSAERLAMIFRVRKQNAEHKATKLVDALRTLLAERGMKIVPVEAAPEMSAWKNTGVHVPLGERIYAAMLSASPDPLEAGDGE